MSRWIYMRTNADPVNHLGPAKKDRFVADSPNDGARFLFDAGFEYSYPGGPIAGRQPGANPVNGQPIYDVAMRGVNGAASVDAPNRILYAGKGFDFSPTASLNAVGNYIATPADAVNDIVTAYGGKVQRFLVAMYIKTPAVGDWNTSAGIIHTMMQSANGAHAYHDAPDLLMLRQSTSSTKSLTFSRQTAINAISSLGLSLTDADRGVFTLLAYWRNDAGTGMMLRNTAGRREVVAGVVGADNAETLTGTAFRFGPCGFFGNPGNAGTGSKWKLYRAMIENLARSARDPAYALDADWNRVMARRAADPTLFV
ncbi:MAG: hypothetical protein GAK28_04786 [Luteibacter sp.]|uniref:hypothetical protein n=1 Tax=Luteibacter sp. TaxID=1886636 RepID=UPI00137ECEBA|nr:hypothetical protein [Luteibacter sp.]KAF1003347.1 MAG: hypothetical protein GAK28_04786 [Luteibacter sp.]